MEGSLFHQLSIRPPLVHPNCVTHGKRRTKGPFPSTVPLCHQSFRPETCSLFILSNHFVTSIRFDERRKSTETKIMWVLCAPLAAAFVLGPVVVPPAAPLRTSSPSALALPAVPLLVPGIGAAALSFLGLRRMNGQRAKFFSMVSRMAAHP